uniref:carcinoembryonic antigen-related cell adhesion molecule 1-like n=1 Tax=Gasterosteus aculeatus aculeatus TaxID=481459 RepID=UPI001A9904FB|nr:carcinoembryonic antigen-related cell adhesion molecule 1-like [Gasterosteus aculeatus aculeatus]
MEIAAIHFIVLMAMSGLTKGAGVLPDGPLNAAVGETHAPNNTDLKNVSGIFVSDGSLELRNVTSNDSGQYSVIIVRDGGKIAVGVTELDVNERISGASVISETNLSIEGNSFNLSCDADGSMISREWKKDGVKLTPDDHLSLQENNRVLTFNSLSRNDTGVYLCNVTNPVSQEEAEYKMVVYYGPENVQIKGPSDIDLKTTLTLTCSAESVPASYTWMLNSTEIHNSAVYTKDNTESSDNGIYTCEVMNNVTGRTSSALHGLSVTGPPGLSDGSADLSVGAISGIVILCLAASSAGAGGGYYIYKKKINKNATPRPESKELEVSADENTFNIYEN